MTKRGEEDNETTAQTQMAAPFVYHDGLIPKFNGVDTTYTAEKWAEDVEENAAIFQWTPVQTLIIARRSLTGVAAMWLKTEKVFKTFDDLKNAILKEFPDLINSKEAHELLAGRKKEKNETFYEYMLHMKELGKRGKIADYVAIQYIIDGISDYESNKVMLYGIKTYSALKEKLLIYEKMKKNSQNSVKTINKPKTAATTSTFQNRGDERRCFKCGDRGHLSSSCSKGEKCFKCGAFGHIAPRCTSTTNMTDRGSGSVGHRQPTTTGSGNERRTMCAIPTERERDLMRDVGSTEETSYQDGGERYDVLNVNKEVKSKKSMKTFEISGVTVCGLIDTGSDLNLMTEELFFALNEGYFTKEKMQIGGIGAGQVNVLGKIRTKMNIDGLCFDSMLFHIVPCDAMPFRVILGQPFLQDVTVIFNKGSINIMAQSDGDLLRCMLTDVDPHLQCYIPNDDVRAATQELVRSYKPVQVKEAPIEMRIILKDDIPVVQRPRRLSLHEQKIVDEQVDEWLHKGIVKPSFSEYASPLVLVKKKNGSVRVCVDYRKLNAKMVKDQFPLPVIDDHIDKLSGAKIFSKLDLTDAEKKYSSYELEALAIVEGVKKFRRYLLGIPFKIVMDCLAFEMTLKKKDLSTRVARWVLLLQEYNYTIEHRSGTRMRHVDALSRNPYISVVTRNIHEQMKKSQQGDEELQAIMEVLKEKPYLDYFEQNGLLYKGEEGKIVVPKLMDMEIIRKVHENGHFGRKKMIEVLNKDYYIKNMTKKIEEVIVSCIPCILAMRKEGKQEGFLNCIEKEDLPLSTIHCDHIGPLSETRKQYNYILTIVDAFTKFVWLFPTKSTTAKETIDKLRVHQQMFGNPSRIITDRGAAFISNDFTEYCESEDIKHSKIVTGIPRGNGQVERIHRTLISVITKMCIEDEKQWYKHVSRVQRCLNSTYQRSIGTSPYELLVGTKMKQKEDIELVTLLQEESREQFCQKRDNLRVDAKIQILKIQEENRKHFNKRRKESQQYVPGNLVAIKRTQFGTSMKLKPKFLGPYKVVKSLGRDRYEVEKADSAAEGPRRTTSAADHMKRWPEVGNI